MPKKFLTAVFAVALAVTTTGCFEELVVPIDEEFQAQVEFAQRFGQTFASQRGGYGFQFADGQTISLTVNLIGAQRSTDTTVDVAVVGDETTAVEGDQYSFPNGSQVTIPAGESSGELQILLPEGPLDNASATILQLELQDTGDVVAADNLDDFTVQIFDL